MKFFTKTSTVCAVILLGMFSYASASQTFSCVDKNTNTEDILSFGADGQHIELGAWSYYRMNFDPDSMFPNATAFRKNFGSSITYTIYVENSLLGLKEKKERGNLVGRIFSGWQGLLMNCYAL